MFAILDWKAPGFCQGSLSWVVCNNGDYPVGAVKSGLDKDGGTMYVGRCFYEGDLLPAKVAPTHECAFVSYGGKEICRNEYE
uniref:DUF3421 domain-containing protein n=1 Tax=Rhodnius prolixus TaxID=13249 RepID=T1I462_RHOPR